MFNKRRVPIQFWISLVALVLVISGIITISVYAGEAECLFSGTDDEGERTPYGWCWNDTKLEGYLMSCEGAYGICSELDCLDVFPCAKIVGTH